MLSWSVRHCPLQPLGFRSYVHILVQRVLGPCSPTPVPSLHEQSMLACDKGVRLEANAASQPKPPSKIKYLLTHRDPIDFDVICLRIVLIQHLLRHLDCFPNRIWYRWVADERRKLFMDCVYGRDYVREIRLGTRKVLCRLLQYLPYQMSLWCYRQSMKI